MHRIMMLAIAMLITASVAAANVPKGQLAGMVNINTATASELMLLPGIGKAKAGAIIEHRQAAAFKSPQELSKVKGIGNKMLARIQNYISIEGPTTLKIVKGPISTVPTQPAQTIK